ncbi:hypothetical protein PIB30_109795, partial [Stylosanthes scabra]|nr:hypothetical protein [Stylosanthes scabra]
LQVSGTSLPRLGVDSPKTFSFLYKRAIPASGPDQIVSLYEWISFPRRNVDQAIFQLTL